MSMKLSLVIQRTIEFYDAEIANTQVRRAKALVALGNTMAEEAGIAVGSVVYMDGAEFKVLNWTLYGPEKPLYLRGFRRKRNGDWAKAWYGIGIRWTLVP